MTETKEKPRRPYSIICGHREGDPQVKQSFKDECDINNIMSEFTRTGRVVGNVNPGSYMFCPAVDFKEAVDLVFGIQETFDELPSKIRARFSNSPEELLSFLEDPANRDEAVQLGLAVGDAPVQGSDGGETPPSPPPAPLAEPSSEPPAAPSSPAQGDPS